MASDFEARLEHLYPGRGHELNQRLQTVVEPYLAAASHEKVPTASWDQSEVVLITYADQIRSPEATPLATLSQWLQATQLDQYLSTVHLLPFCPHSSDDGFSVIDYLAVDPEVGSWDDVAHLASHVNLMFDLVLNHISRHSEWFQKYLAGEAPYDEFFLEADPSLDYSQVVRPRSLPLLTPVETSHGERHVWTTFSDDQIDLNYATPEVLLEMLRVLLEYAQRGARIVRLDAVAFLWKQLGTTCVHLPQTHEVVKLMREVLAHTFPQTLLLTETNVPHTENISYFGVGDEAHLVYQFSLPPLLLDAFTSGDAVYLRRWLATLASPPPGCTFFNFTASHDGIGVRPLEGLVPAERVERLLEAVKARGGRVSTRRQADGSETPYELNITYLDALAPTPEPTDEPVARMQHARRFLSSQAIMLALPGIPAVYFQSLVGGQNDEAGVVASGMNRRINRHKYELSELETHLANEDSLAAIVHKGYRQLLAVRCEHPAFHPNAPLQLLTELPDTVLGFVRTSVDGRQRLLVVVNFGTEEFTFCPTTLLGQPEGSTFRDPMLEGSQRECTIPAGGFTWLARG